MARRVFAVGETLLDIIFKKGQPLAATAGGSMLNTGVSLGRLHIPVYMLSEYGNDPTGAVVEKFLHDNGVSLAFAKQFNGRTSVALAYLNEYNDADYTFFHEEAEESLRFSVPEFRQDDVILFGSLYSMINKNRKKIKETIEKAQLAGAILFYDPNFRSSFLGELEQLKPGILDNIKCADIVRGSDEDFQNLLGRNDPLEVYSVLESTGINVLLYTRSHRDVHLFAPNFQGAVPVDKIKTVSTIGAGDSFNAGIVYAIIRDGIMREDLKHLSARHWEDIVRHGIDFAGHVCQRLENYISASFAIKRG